MPLGLAAILAGCANPTVKSGRFAYIMPRVVQTGFVQAATDEVRTCSFSVTEFSGGDVGYEKRHRGLTLTVGTKTGFGSNQPALIATLFRADASSTQDKYARGWPVKLDRISFGTRQFTVANDQSFPLKITADQPFAGNVFAAAKPGLITTVSSALSAGQITVAYTIISPGYRLTGQNEGDVWTIPTIATDLDRRHLDEFQGCIADLDGHSAPARSSPGLPAPPNIDQG